MILWVERMVSDAPAMKNMSWENHRAPKTQPWKVDEGGWSWEKKQRWLKKSVQIAVDFAGLVLRGLFCCQLPPAMASPEILNWLPVSNPKNDGVRQLGWWHSQYDGKVIKAMFQTTNQWRFLFWPVINGSATHRAHPHVYPLIFWYKAPRVWRLQLCENHSWSIFKLHWHVSTSDGPLFAKKNRCSHWSQGTGVRIEVLGILA